MYVKNSFEEDKNQGKTRFHLNEQNKRRIQEENNLNEQNSKPEYKAV